ncbi:MULTISPECIES: hypothetical protein [unclassified Streptomyces]|uniref:hypothetical protein n=1 Tax=unclassified Streptomyces TaxID=2593676 RepID=UPI000DB946C3|nr:MULTISPECIES: hypothetical protein [unclassified Streptomyces]MYT75154.1 hypothetical protein [Streptomyces sp. SID8367]RAJ77110.1 hypothetical protein K377_05868 [Streptomyces sp. PsTaAH-137]
MAVRISRRSAGALGVVLVLALLGCGLWWFTARDGRDDAGTPTRTWSYTEAKAVAGARDGGFNPRAIASGKGVLVAAGDAPEPSGDGYDLDAWYSTDAVTWKKGDLRTVGRGAGWYSEFTDLMAWDGGFVVAGKGIDSSGGLGVVSSAPAFFSADGRTWRLLDPPDPTATGRPSYFTDGAHLYASVDGRALWRLAGDARRWQAVDARAPEGCGLRGRADAPDTGDAVITGVCDPNGATRPALYRVSDDGASLRDLTPSLPGNLVGEVADAAVHADTVLLSGRREVTSETGATPAPDGEGALDGGGDDMTRSVLLRSTDGGGHWSDVAALPVPADAKPGSGVVTDLLVVGDTFVATGSVLVNELFHPALWVSRDGAHWTPHRLRAFAESGYLGPCAALKGRVVVPALTGQGPIHTAGLFTFGPSGSGAPSPARSVPSAAPSESPGTVRSTPPSSGPAPSATAALGPEDVYALAAPWSGEISGGTDRADRYRVLVTLSPGAAAEPTVRDLRGNLKILGDRGCTATLDGPTVRADGTLVFHPGNQKAPLPGMVLEGSHYCPDTVELRRIGSGELAWSSDGGYTGRITPGAVD